MAVVLAPIEYKQTSSEIISVYKCVYCNSGYNQWREFVAHKIRHGYTAEQVQKIWR